MTGLRLMSDGEQGAFARSANVPFLDAGNEDAEGHWSASLEVGRSWVAEDGARIIGQCCTFTRDLTVPGPPGEPCPALAFTAVSGVGVHPTHRRQGLLTTMMAEMLADGRRRGEVVAGLLASESVIYGRYGFGTAASAARTTIDVRRASFRSDLAPPLRSIELLGAEEAAAVLPALHDRARRRRPGDVSRDDATWGHVWSDPPARRSGMSARMYAVAEEGFAVYRGVEGGDDTPGRLSVRDIYATDAATEAALFAFLVSIDLVDELTLELRPVDDPLRWRLADPRQMRTRDLTDFIWIRILDTAAALTSRSYAGSGRLVLDVVGAPDPAVGRWVLEAGPGGSTCEPAGAGVPADLRLGLPELGALYLGGVSATTLHLAGRIDEERRGALRHRRPPFPLVSGTVLRYRVLIASAGC